MARDEIQTEINTYKQLLAQTDYQCLKHMDGALSDKEYAPMRKQREEWRERINELEDVMEEEE